MHRIREACVLLCLLGLLILGVICNIQINALGYDIAEISEGVSELRERQGSLAVQVSTWQYDTAEAPKPEEPEFEPLDISLSVELQELTYLICREKDIDPIIMFRIMWRESRFDETAIGYNRNGTADHGICQINDIAFDFLADRGIDPTESPESNIRAACELITYYRDECGCTLLESLAAYGAGLTGMRNGNGFAAARKLISGEGFDF